jgi:uncharacterized protein (TIGR03086 family)
MSTDALARAFAATAAVLDGVRPADLSRPTPCASWQVRDLVRHIANGPAGFASLVETGGFPAGQDEPDADAPDVAVRFRQDAAKAVSAFAAPGALDRTVTLPFATMPAGQYLWIAACDSFTHGWDLARALGQPTDLDPELAGVMLQRVAPMLPDALRGPDGQAPFSPAVQAGEDATAADRLAAFLGRQL